MKVTISSAMRARDVSRPRAEQVADAEAAEASALKGTRVNGPGETPAKGQDKPGDEVGLGFRPA